jgi:hypothetical protein
MMSALAAQAAPWLAAALILLAAGIAATVLGARSLLSVAVSIAAVCGCAAGALLALGQGEGALGLALLGAGVAPVLLLAGVLLSGRAVQPKARGLPWLTIGAAGAAAAAMLWTAPMIEPTEAIAAPRGAAPLALTAVVFVAVAACVALVGYGERGFIGGSRGE